MARESIIGSAHMKYFLATTLCLTLASLNAQAPPKPIVADDDPAARITLDVTRVNMLFTVSDKKGRFVTDLNKEEFEILEAMVEAGPLVDGVTGLATPTVDGLSFEKYADVLTRLLGL